MKPPEAGMPVTRRPVGARRKATWRAKLVLLATSCLICFLGFETYIRLTWGGHLLMPMSAMRTDTTFTFRHKPNIDLDVRIPDGGTFHVHTNELGFRGPTVASIANKKLKIVSIGDSFAFGWGIKENEHALTRFVEGYDRAHPDRGVGLATVSCMGWGPDDYLYAFNSEVVPTKVDLVLVGVFPENDLLEQSYPRSITPWRTQPRDYTPPHQNWLWPRSIGYFHALLNGSVPVNRLAIKLGVMSDIYGRFSTDPSAQAKVWETTSFYLDELVKSVRASGAEVVIICYPSADQVGAPAKIDSSGYDHSMPEKMLGEFCGKRSVQLITLLDDLVAANGNNDLYYPLDRHLTVKGHDVVITTLEMHLTPIVDEISRRKLEGSGGK